MGPSFPIMQPLHRAIDLNNNTHHDREENSSIILSVRGSHSELRSHREPVVRSDMLAQPLYQNDSENNNGYFEALPPSRTSRSSTHSNQNIDGNNLPFAPAAVCSPLVTGPA